MNKLVHTLHLRAPTTYPALVKGLWNQLTPALDAWPPPLLKTGLPPLVPPDIQISGENPSFQAALITLPCT